MKQFLMSLFSIFLMINPLAAETILDAYGLPQDETAKILAIFKPSIIANAEAWQKSYQKTGTIPKSLALKKNQLIERIKKYGDYVFADFNGIFYPDKPDLYVTLELVKSNQKERLAFIHQDEMTHSKPRRSPHQKRDIIDEMTQFIKMQHRLMMTEKIDLKDRYCPVWHCVLGFQDRRLKPFLDKFNQAAKKDHTFIIQTLFTDPSPERRASAAFLSAHFKDPQELMHHLMRAIQDKSPLVRNNAIRVIGELISKAPEIELDLKPFIHNLNSPYIFDRNKSLLVLAAAVHSEKNKALIERDGRQALIALLALKQPNNHVLAYEILQNISGASWDEYDLKSWEVWASNPSLTQNNHLKPPKRFIPEKRPSARV